ncbi:MAG: Fructokinase [Gammaproteobacteria bacterium]|nr:Fructokinase [Gammaproteobacteria bacterium]
MRIGVDLGGTKIELIALEDDGRLLTRTRVDTPREGYRAVLEAIVALVHAAESELQRRGTIGIGMPGVISPATGLVKNANSVCLNGQPFDRDIAAALQREVRVANDANCFALSEATDGAGAGVEVVFGAILGTGVGGGVVVRGGLLTGPNAIAGEWGHNPLPWPNSQELPGPQCYCGKRGCIETFCSGPGLVRDLAANAQPTLTAREVVAAAEQGGALADQAVQRYEERLAKSLASVVNVIDPHVIVLGGGLSNVRRLYHTLPRLIPKYAFSDRICTPIVPARYGDASGVRGAAWLWPTSSG